MAKYVKCIDNYKIHNLLKVGNCYKILFYTDSNYRIVDELGCEDWFNIDYFGEPYELPEPITFASQEDFENAVMAVIMKRLSIHSHEAYIQVGDFGSSV